MLENRSYDHYFGAYPRGRGFDDHPKHSLGVFAQDYPGGGSNVVPKHKLLPFHLPSNHGLESTDDLTHDWGPMHECWNHGKMDSWVKVHTQHAVGGSEGRDDDGLLRARPSCRSTGRSPTTSRSATPTTARSSARRTPTG